jgi:hypothetical protein
MADSTTISATFGAHVARRIRHSPILLLSGFDNKAPHPEEENHETAFFPACACLKQAFEFVSGV